MKNFNSTQKLNLFLILVFAFVAFITNVDVLFKIDPVPARPENRLRATLPSVPHSLSELNLKKIFSDFDSYYSDNFGFRNLLIKSNSIIKYFIFKTSPSDRVVIGKSPWLFLARDGNMESYRNLKPFTEDELAAFTLLIKERQAWAKKNGIQYIYMVGPDSHTLNSEFLPDWATKVHPGSRFDQLIEYAKRTANIDILDVRPALLEAKKTGVVSISTDSHWNSFGGYIAYQEILKRIRQEHPEVAPSLPFEDFELKKLHQYGQDLTRLIGLEDLIFDDGEALNYKKKDSYVVKDYEGLHFTTENTEVADFPIVLVSDSMAGNLYPHLARHFSKMRVMWGYPFDVKEIKKYHPKVIIHMVIERILMLYQIDNPPEVKDALKQ